MSESPEEAMRNGAVVSEPGESWEERLVRAMRYLPPDCPFSPVGTSDGTQWLISHTGELRGLGPKELSRNGISALVGIHQPWLIEYFPRKKRDANTPPDSFSPEKIADAIIQACRIMGVWRPDNHIRGRGAWRGEDGALIVHLGDKLLIGSRQVECGRRGEFVYPVLERLPRPAQGKMRGGQGGPAAAVLERLSTFNFRRGELDRMLLLGWICCGFLAGALETRPHGWITGERGTGKSTLLLLVKTLFLSGQGVISVSDTTAAGLWQALQHDALACCVDELESEADNARSDSIIKLARQASTGGVVLRGGADHKSAQFVARSTFLFSAITMPAMRAQDRSRVFQIDLLPLEANMRPFSVSQLAEHGRGLFRRMLDGWMRFEKESLPLYRDELMQAGWDARGAAVYGTLLAAADVALYDTPQQDIAHDLVLLLEDARMQHRADEAPSWRRCLDHMLAAQVDPGRRGERVPLGGLVLRAAGYGDGLTRTPEQEDGAAIDPAMRSEVTAQRQAQLPEALIAHDQLRALGLRLAWAPAEVGRPSSRYLAVANAHPALSDLFRGTDWSSEPGRPGAWRQALARTPAALMSGNTTRFRGVATRAVMVPIEAVLAGLVGHEQLPDGVEDKTRELYRPDEAPARPAPEPGSFEPDEEAGP